MTGAGMGIRRHVEGPVQIVKERCLNFLESCHSLDSSFFLVGNIFARHDNRPSSDELRAAVAVDAPHYSDFCAQHPRAKVLELITSCRLGPFLPYTAAPFKPS